MKKNVRILNGLMETMLQITGTHLELIHIILEALLSN